MSPVTDLADPSVRERVRERLARQHAGRPVLLGPGILAGYTDQVARLRATGCPVLVVSTGDGAGPLPPADSCTVVPVELPPTASMTEEVRVLDRVAHHLPAHAVAAIEAFDPERRGIWRTSPFVTDDEPILGRPVTGGRPAAFLALEDKMLADDIWAAAGVPHAPHEVLDVDTVGLDGLAAATERLAGPLGAVWSGDARDGVNGGGNFVQWVADRADRAAAFAFFAPRCDRVRVMPFLDGVPCSIHGVVIPGEGTAVFRPVELAILRQPSERRFVYGGLSTWWDPPAADREEMREAARRVGAHLAAEHGYRGTFGIDGVLTADGFRPTELNTRMSAGATTVASVDRDLLTLVQTNLVAGRDTGLGVADVESLLPLMDAERVGRPVAVGQGSAAGGVGGVGGHTIPVTIEDGELVRAAADAGSTLVTADTPIGFFAKVDPCALLAPGDRLAPLNAALLRFLDRELGTSFGPLVAAPDLRT